MKATELRAMTREELTTELGELKSELFKLRFQHATNQLTNPQQLKYVKRNIARVLTVMREMELEKAKGEDK
jgi:large subunit ribosomal protein L29